MSDITTQTADPLKAAYEKVFAAGALIQVRVSKWSMSSQLTSSDLKVEKDIPTGLFQLGRKLLISPAEKSKFDRLEAKARNLLNSYAFPFPIAQAHFVPKNKVIEVMQELEKCKAQYAELTETFLANYAQFKADMLTKHPEYADVLEPYYPSVEKLRPKFGFSFSQFKIEFPKEVTGVSLDELLVQHEAKEEAVEQYKAMMATQYQEALGTMHSFVQESVSTLRSEAAKACSYVYGKIQRKEQITKTNLNTITEMIGNFESLNFFNDTAVNQQLQRLKQTVTSDVDFKLDEDAIAGLSNALQAVVAKATSTEDLTSLTDDYLRDITV